MNSLEFVNEKINWTILKIKDHEEHLLTFKGNKERNVLYIFECQCLNYYKEELEKFKQLKTELESLKIIKEKLVLSVKTETATDENGVSITGFWLVQGDSQKIYKIINLGEYETLRNGLEVNE